VVKAAARGVDIIKVSDSYRPASTGVPVNHFGTPVSTPGATAAQSFTSDAAWQPPAGAAGPVRRSSTPAGGNLVTIAIVLVLVVAGGLALRHYVFPDRHKPLALPATIAGLSRVGPVDPLAATQAAGQQAMVRSAKGVAVDLGVYTNPQVRNELLVVTAGRMSRSARDRASTQPPYTKVGEVTCTQTIDPSASFTAPGTPSAGARTYTDRAVCWRETRALTVAAIVITPQGSPVETASSAVTAVWDAQ
jgi:hypothetical protein